MPSNTLYHIWFQWIQELRPNQRVTQVRNFDWLTCPNGTKPWWLQPSITPENLPLLPQTDFREVNGQERFHK